MQTVQQVTKQQQARIINRMQQRIAVVQALRASKHVARIAARQQAAFITQVQQLAAQYGINTAQVLKMHNSNNTAARANSGTATPSAAQVMVNGVPYKPTKAVHALCAANPTATRAQLLAMCAQHGINPATASTQVGLYRAANKAQ